MTPTLRIDTSAATIARRPATRQQTVGSTSSNRRRSSESTTSPTGIANRLRRFFVNEPSPDTTLTDHIELNEPSTYSQPTVPPLERFRNAVHTIIHSNRLRSVIAGSNDPGLDHRRSTIHHLYGQLNSTCDIQVIDFGPNDAFIAKMTNDDLRHFLSENKRPRQCKVRWINVSGLSWDVMSLLADRYDLHPLAVEDVFEHERHTMSKADWYHQHLFLRLLCHVPREQAPTTGSTPVRSSVSDISSAGSTSRLMHGQEPPPLTGPSTGCQPDPASSTGQSLQQPPVSCESHSATRALAGLGLATAQPWSQRAQQVRMFHGLSQPHSRSRQGSFRVAEKLGLASKEAYEAPTTVLIDKLKERGRVHVDKRNLYIFYTKKGTLITVTPSAQKTVVDRVIDHLGLKGTLLRQRSTGCALILTILNQVAEQGSVLVEQFRRRIQWFEERIQAKALNRNIILQMHVASGDLQDHYSTLKPLALLVRHVRMHDAAKTRAAADDEQYARDNKKDFQGYINNINRTYFADTEDQMTEILRACDSFASKVEAMLDFQFRTSQNATSQLVRQYTILLVVFSPLIIIAQYYGMNFETGAVHTHSDVLFWKSAVPALAAILLAVLWESFSRFVESTKFAILAKKIRKNWTP